MGGASSRETSKLRKKLIGPKEYAYYATRRDLPLTHAERPPTPPWLPDLNAADPVYFAFERLSDASVEFWNRYCELQADKTRRGQVPVGEGLVAFQETIRVYKKRCGEQYDMWVAYVTTAEPTALSHRATLIPEELTDDNWDTADQTQIEMVVTVLVDRKSPFTSHSGIFRTERFWIPKEKKPATDAIPFGHKGLSLPLHQFAAVMSRELYSHIKVHNSFMVTKPVDKMGEILRKSGLVAGEDFIAGSRKERAEHKDREYMPPLNQPPVPFVTESGENDSIWDTKTETHKAPAWMVYPGLCRHRFLGARAHHSDAVTYTIRLSSLARLWPQGP